MNKKIQCANPDCGRIVDANPRAKNQSYCGRKPCQRARKRKWQKQKMAVDPDYKANQRECQIDWHARHPDYYRKYRQKHPAYCQRNRLLQNVRNARARVIAKMDTLESASIKHTRAFYLLPLIAKMDASAQKVIIIPIS